MVDAALDALKGEDKFKGSPVAVRTLMVLYPNRMHVVSIEGTGVTNMADLKGKRVSTGSPGSATEVMAFRVIEGAGLDIATRTCGASGSASPSWSTRSRTAGSTRSSGSAGCRPPPSPISARRPNVKIEMVDHADVVEKMNDKYGGIYTSGVIPAKTYPGQDKDNAIAVVQNILVANAKMPDQVAYDIVKTFIEKQKELIAVHAEAASIVLENQLRKNTHHPVASGRGALLQRARREDVTRASTSAARPVVMPRASGRMTLMRVARHSLWWRIVMIAGGFAFGLFADRRPFGETFLAHPIVVFAAHRRIGSSRSARRARPSGSGGHPGTRDRHRVPSGHRRVPRRQLDRRASSSCARLKCVARR